MKRIVSIFLVFAMLLTLMPMNIFAANEKVFSDVKSSDYYAEAAEVLEKLGILTGYPDGTFGADKSITRSEMAAIVCRMIDKEDDAKKATGETKFDDVSSDHWASGYINMASEEGIINGDGNGEFRPEDDVKHEEALKMVVCALGYADDVEIDPDDWSAAYIDVADEKGISKNLRGKKGKASTRGDVAVMSYNGISAREEAEVEVAAPTASLKAGSYVGSQKVELKTTTKGAEIYYTTNGSEPTTKSKKYSKAVQISETCFLRAIAVKDGSTSELMKVGYTILHSSGISHATKYTVSFDLNYEGATGAPKSQIVESGKTATEPDAPVNGEYKFIGWFIDKDDKNPNNYYDFATPIESNVELYAKWIDMKDTDGDGLVDGLEELYGTDKTLTDTDGDELNDYMEIFTFNSKPLLKDTDNNGINDGDEDFDNDGLSNLTEINGVTNPMDNDSDNDDLLDGKEVSIGTNPNAKDTDDDGVSDSKEIELGTDPLVAQSTFSMNLSADNDGEGATASVQIDLSGEQVETLSIQAVDNDTFFPENMPGYMGKAYDFSVDGEFDSATISFEFDSTEIGSDGVPVIYYFNEETQELEELATTINGNVASAVVSHFSKYVLINRTIREKHFEWIDEWDSTTNYTSVEVILVIDDSGSMGSNDSNNKRLDVARNMVDKLPKNSKVGVVKFANNTAILTSTLTDDKDVAKGYLTTTYFRSSGGTKMYNAINDALPMFGSSDESVMKVMVVLTDGATSDTSKHVSTVESANANNVRIYTVGLGNSTSYFERYLKPLAVNTAAAFYLADDAGQLEEIYNNISQKIDIETDSDDDGVPDYYEDNMILFNGVKIKLDKNDPDTDKDGLSDGTEVVITKEPSADGTKVKVTGRLVMGDPTKPDTDDDGYNDGDDIDSFEEYKMPIILIHGWTSNTTCFGAETAISDGKNDHYGVSKSKNEKTYTSPDDQKITAITGKLSKYLRDSMGYKENKNLFAFNYPNIDMVQYNAAKLSTYISELVSTAKNSKEISKHFFPTKKKEAKVILIGHSMGGLISRYYIENLGTKYVEKLITIDTPHYGSGLANTSDATLNTIKFNPAVYDLDTKSTLYGGKTKKWDIGWRWEGEDSQYGLNNQSPALKGNKTKDVKYYAIGGYNVGRGLYTDFINPYTELDQLAEELRDNLTGGLSFSFEFYRAIKNKDDLKSSINSTLNSISMRDYNEPSELDLGDSDGDNTVDYMSQFAIRFGKNYDYQNLEKTVMILATGHTIASPWHSAILNDRSTFWAVEDFIDD